MENLQIKNNQITIDHETLGSNFNKILESCYQDQTEIVIKNATMSKEQDTVDKTVIKGISNYLNIPDLPTTMTLWKDAKGDLQALIQYQLIGNSIEPNSWYFSKSFPNLPVVLDYETKVPSQVPDNFDVMDEQVPFLDSLCLYQTYFVISTIESESSDIGIELKRGLNFKSLMLPCGMLGALEQMLEDTIELTLYGYISIPLVTDRATALQANDYIWDHPDAPGIHLKADLGVNVQLKNLVLRDFFFQIYSPCSTQWQQRNASYRAYHGYCGVMAIPSADIEVDLVANCQWNLPEFLFDAKCKGVKLGKLTQLADLTGSDSLSAHFPKELQHDLEIIESIELMEIVLSISAYDKVPVLSMAKVKVGIPDLKWTIWDDHLQVGSLSCQIEVNAPFTKSMHTIVDISGTVEIESIPVSITASTRDNFTLYTRLAAGKYKLPLKQLLGTYSSALTLPLPDVTIDYLALEVAPSSHIAFASCLAQGDDAWTIPVGPGQLSVSDVVVNVNCPKQGEHSGSIGGKVTFAKDVSFDMCYDLPGDFIVQGRFTRVNLTHLLEKLVNQKLLIPQGFDLELDYASVLIAEHDKMLRFQLVADVAGIGNFAFEAKQVFPGKWGFACGVDFPTGTPFEIPSLKFMTPITKAFHLQKFMLVLSSFDSTNFQFPDMASLTTPIVATKKVSLPATASGITQGVNLFAEWTLDKNNKIHKAMGTLLGLNSSVGIAAQISEKNAKIFTKVTTEIQKLPLTCILGADINYGKAAGGGDFFLTGAMTVNIQSHPQTFDITMLIVPNGFFFSGDMKGGTAIEFDHLKLSNVAFEMGVSFEGLPSLGIAASIDTNQFDSSFALFFDAAEPEKSLLAGAVSDLSLANVMDVIVPGKLASPMHSILKNIDVRGTHQFKINADIAADLDSLTFNRLAKAFKSKGGVVIPVDQSQLHLIVVEKGKVWNLTDMTNLRHYQLKRKAKVIEVSIEAQFYLAPTDTFIGTLRYPAGFFINAALDIFGFEAKATIDINSRQGIEIDGSLSKIVLGNEHVFALEADQGKGGPRLSVSTFSRPQEKNPLLKKPHFYINGKVSLLGIEESLYITVTEHGAKFDIKGKFFGAIQVELSGTFGIHKLEVDGDIKCGVGSIDLGKLGKVKLDTDIEANLDINVNKKKTSATVEAKFEALGAKHRIGKFHLNVNANSLAHIDRTLEKEAGKVLKQFIDEIGKIAKEVDKDIGKGVSAVGKGVESVGKEIEKDASKVVHDIGHAVSSLFGKHQKKHHSKKKKISQKQKREMIIKGLTTMLEKKIKIAADAGVNNVIENAKKEGIDRKNQEVVLSQAVVMAKSVATKVSQSAITEVKKHQSDKVIDKAVISAVHKFLKISIAGAKVSARCKIKEIIIKQDVADLNKEFVVTRKKFDTVALKAAKKSIKVAKKKGLNRKNFQTTLNTAENASQKAINPILKSAKASLQRRQMEIEIKPVKVCTIKNLNVAANQADKNALAQVRASLGAEVLKEKKASVQKKLAKAKAERKKADLEIKKSIDTARKKAILAASKAK